MRACIRIQYTVRIVSARARGADTATDGQCTRRDDARTQRANAVKKLMAWQYSALLWAAAISTIAATAATPVFGTFFHPNLSDRATYHWTFERAAGCSVLLFGDVNSDRRDDLLRAGCGESGDGWALSLSDGTSGWPGRAVPVWSDGVAAGAQRFAADLDDSGTVDLAAHDARVGRWALTLSDGRGGFGNSTRVMQPCTDGQAYASHGALWCLAGSHWARYDVKTKQHSVRQMHPPAEAALPIMRSWVAEVTNDRVPDAVLLDSQGNVFVGVGSPAGFAPFQLGLSNFSAARGVPESLGTWHVDDCEPQELLLAESSPAVGTWLRQRGGGSAALVCVSAGVWIVSGIDIKRPASEAAAPILNWKFAHGGIMGGAKPPRPTGWKGGENDLFHYTSFHLADPVGSGSPAPLACNLTAQHYEHSPRCLIIPASSAPTARDGFAQTVGVVEDAPAFSSTNVNEWDAWHVNYRALLHDGTFGEYESMDLRQQTFALERLRSHGFSLFILDNSNGLGADWNLPWTSTLTLTALLARMNAATETMTAPGLVAQQPLSYAIQLGVDCIGAWADPAVLPRMEAQVQMVFQTFFNSTDAAVAAIQHNGGASPVHSSHLASAQLAWSCLVFLPSSRYGFGSLPQKKTISLLLVLIVAACLLLLMLLFYQAPMLSMQAPSQPLPIVTQMENHSL